MVKIVDRVVGWLLVLGAVLHAFGSLQTLAWPSPTLVWALAASLAALLLAAINLMRVNRPGDRTLALVSLAGCLAWVAVAIAFGATIGNIFDPRAMYHAVAGLALAGFSLRAVLGAKP